MKISSSHRLVLFSHLQQSALQDFTLDSHVFQLSEEALETSFNNAAARRGQTEGALQILHTFLHASKGDGLSRASLHHNLNSDSIVKIDKQPFISFALGPALHQPLDIEAENDGSEHISKGDWPMHFNFKLQQTDHICRRQRGNFLYGFSVWTSCF